MVLELVLLTGLKSKFWSRLSPYFPAQQNGLWTVIQALQNFPTEALHIVGDSKYVVGVVKTIYTVSIHVNNSILQDLFLTLQNLLQKQNHVVFIVHMRPHTKLPGHLTKENNPADALVSCASVKDELNPMLLICMFNTKFLTDKLTGLFLIVLSVIP